MQPLHEREIEDAKKKLAVLGRNLADFSFDVEFMEPDPDGGGMYTVRYAVAVANSATMRTASYIGGIGMDWVDAFEEAVKAGEFG